MKNITKILFVAITSLSLMLTAKAGEMTVNGTAKATYNATSGQQKDNGIGITNELTFTASGEMDNGYTWSYSMALDPTTTGDTATSPSNKLVKPMAGSTEKRPFCGPGTGADPFLKSSINSANLSLERSS